MEKTFTTALRTFAIVKVRSRVALILDGEVFVALEARVDAALDVAEAA